MGSSFSASLIMLPLFSKIVMVQLAQWSVRNSDPHINDTKRGFQEELSLSQAQIRFRAPQISQLFPVKDIQEVSETIHWALKTCLQLLGDRACLP